MKNWLLTLIWGISAFSCISWGDKPECTIYFSDVIHIPILIFFSSFIFCVNCKRCMLYLAYNIYLFMIFILFICIYSSAFGFTQFAFGFTRLLISQKSCQLDFPLIFLHDKYQAYLLSLGLQGSSTLFPVSISFSFPSCSNDAETVVFFSWRNEPNSHLRSLEERKLWNDSGAC